MELGSFRPKAPCGATVLVVVGWLVFVGALPSALCIDWRYSLIAGALGMGSMLAGVMWMGNASGPGSARDCAPSTTKAPRPPGR